MKEVGTHTRTQYIAIITKDYLFYVKETSYYSVLAHNITIVLPSLSRSVILNGEM